MSGNSGAGENLEREKDIAKKYQKFGSLRSRSVNAISVNLKNGGDVTKLGKLPEKEKALIESLDKREKEESTHELTAEESNVVVSDSLNKFAKARNLFERRGTLSKPLMPFNKYAIPASKQKDTHRLVEEALAEDAEEAVTKERQEKSENTDQASVVQEKHKSVKELIAGAEVAAKPPKKNFKIKRRPEWELVKPEFVEAFWMEYDELHEGYYDAFAIKGWRPGMEDVMDTFYTRNANLKQLFAVYDGHGGDECALYCKKYLLRRLSLHSQLNANPKSALADSFISVDAKYIEKATDSGSMAGTTATVLYVTPVLNAQKKRAYKYYLACVGDSRAVLVYTSGKVVPLSDDHNLKRKDELQRVKDGGGEVYYDTEFDEILVYSEELERGLNVTRTIGDKDFKPLVTSFPELSDGYLDSNCAYIIMASDGLWGKVSNEEAGKVLLEYGTKAGTENLANLANARGSFDNVTLMAIDITQIIKEMEKAYP
mmetsp:Transcript_13690/g.15586  ORF Transcript_13690/g.15586 Transcript_13690/m.15586 type:complete len:486 (-) Transcript_13690:1304-2761(-)